MLDGKLHKTMSTFSNYDYFYQYHRINRACIQCYMDNLLCDICAHSKRFKEFVIDSVTKYITTIYKTVIPKNLLNNLYYIPDVEGLMLVLKTVCGENMFAEEKCFTEINENLNYCNKCKDEVITYGCNNKCINCCIKKDIPDQIKLENIPQIKQLFKERRIKENLANHMNKLSKEGSQCNKYNDWNNKKILSANDVAQITHYDDLINKYTEENKEIVTKNNNEINKCIKTSMENNLYIKARKTELDTLLYDIKNRQEKDTKELADFQMYNSNKKIAATKYYDDQITKAKNKIMYDAILHKESMDKIMQKTDDDDTKQRESYKLEYDSMNKQKYDFNISTKSSLKKTFTELEKTINGTIEQIITMLHESTMPAKICLGCYSKFPIYKLNKICSTSCQGTMCTPCIEQFHNTIKPGNIINGNSNNCIWCRNKKISPENLTKWNSLLSNLPYDDIKFSDDYYGICSECVSVEFYCEKSCTEDMPTTNKFICTKCRPDAPKIVECPSCTISTIKSSGCNHITCRCGAEYCYVCVDGVYKTKEELTEHFDKFHGGSFY